MGKSSCCNYTFWALLGGNGVVNLQDEKKNTHWGSPSEKNTPYYTYHCHWEHDLNICTIRQDDHPTSLWTRWIHGTSYEIIPFCSNAPNASGPPFAGNDSNVYHSRSGQGQGIQRRWQGSQGPCSIWAFMSLPVGHWAEPGASRAGVSVIRWVWAMLVRSTASLQRLPPWPRSKGHWSWSKAKESRTQPASPVLPPEQDEARFSYFGKGADSTWRKITMHQDPMDSVDTCPMATTQLVKSRFPVVPAEVFILFFVWFLESNSLPHVWCLKALGTQTIWGTGWWQPGIRPN